ncbi:MAG: DinB family protein [Acidobacteriota bacterium]|nr:DinB family protein [Acidobacteriota bacterium]
MPMKQAGTETERIARQLRLFYEGPSWLGPPLKELLSDIGEEHARRRGLTDAHTIWDLVLHIAGWLRIARERLSATHTRDMDAAEDWPPMADSWNDALSSLETETDALEQAILKFPEERLQESAPATEAQTFYVLLHGVIQHSAYHAGQIALLKKLK